jgi:hypothetical protein
LLGYATGYLPSGLPGDPNPTESDVVPANVVQGSLYPKRVNALTTLTPAYDRPQFTAVNTLFTTAVWPNGEGLDRGAGQPDQRFGPADGPAMRAFMTGDPTNPCQNVPRYFYNISGYDMGMGPNGTGGLQAEVRYTLFWTGWTVPAIPCSPQSGGAGVGEMGSASDNPRQLGYTEPPTNTVVTWDSWFRELDLATGQPQYEQKRDIVLFSDGSAKAFDTQSVMSQAYQVTP